MWSGIFVKVLLFFAMTLGLIIGMLGLKLTMMNIRLHVTLLSLQNMK